MKTIRKLLLLCLFGMISMGESVYAFDFSATYNGKVIYYIITSRTAPFAVEVAKQGSYEYEGDISIPPTVTYDGKTYAVERIGEEAFCLCEKITSISLPSSITSIGRNAFRNCTNMLSVNFPSSVTKIEAGAFLGCSSLTNVSLPYYLSNIENSTFSGCSSLKSVTLPNSVTSIGAFAFNYCSSLKSVTLPNSVLSLGDWAFYGCKSLTSITIPNSVTNVGERVFEACANLTQMNVSSSNTKYDSRDECNAIIETTSNKLIEGCGNTIIPNSVTSIGEYAFSCSNKTSIVIPNSVTSIGENAFYGCEKLSNVVLPTSITTIANGVFSFSGLIDMILPNSVKSIGYNAFSNCENLTSIEIPAVYSIGADAFSYCANLKNVSIKRETPLDISEDDEINYYGSFRGSTNLSNITLHVPYGTKSLYESADVWKDFGIIVEMDPEDILCTSIELNKPTAELKIGETLTLTATVLLETATDKTVTWTSNNESVATVANGLVTAVTAGKATITAKTNDGSNLAAICEVTVISGGATSGIEPSTDITTLANTLYFNDTEHRAGDFELALNMKNAKENITAFQCDIYLPEGVEWKSTTDKRGNTVYDLPTFNEDRTDDSYHTIAPMAKNADGSYNIIVYSMDNANILEADGVLLTLPLTISEDMEAGDYNLRIKNIVMTDVDANQVKIAEVVSKLTIPSYEIGDANGDDEINVTDIVQTISYIRGGNPANFIIGAADVNADGEINVTDIVNIIKIIRSAQAPAGVKSRKATVKKSALPSNLEVIPFTVAEGSTSATVQLDMNNPGDEFTAFQCDVYFPEGIDWASTIDKRGNKKITNATFNSEAERTDASYHMVDVGLNANNSYNVMVYSMDNEIFLEESGAILDMPFVFDADLEPGTYDITLKHIVMTRPDGTDVKPDDYTFTILVGSPEIASATLHGDYTADAISELNTALASNTVLSAIDFTEATSVDASTKIETGNKNLLVYVSEGTEVANSQNVVEGDECESLMLTDGYNFAAPKAFTAVSASYSRTAPSTYGTIVLPFVPVTNGAEFYELTGAGTTSLEFQKTVAPVAGTPYLYRATTDNFTATNAEIAATEAGKVTASGWTMQGTYGKEVFDAEDNVYAVSGGKLYHNTGTLTMNPFRAYFTGGTSGAPMNISIDGTTVIGSVENSELTIDGEAYNLAGQKVSKGYKGIVITNGRKEIRK